MQVNRRSYTPAPRTHEGAIASRIDAKEQLIRSVMACMLWEDGFYEDGIAVADRIAHLVHAVPLEVASAVAIEARNNMKLRHVPLLIVREMARHPKLHTNPRIVSDTLVHVIQRPDELTEFMAIYWAKGKCPLSKQVKLGLAKAFTKFNEYQLAKYNRKKDIMLRDVLFLCHSKPADVSPEALHWAKGERKFADDPAFCHEQRPHGFSDGELLYGKLIYDQLTTPDTWEVELSAGGDKQEVFTRLMRENKLGDLAFLRNLRNMVNAGVSQTAIADYGDLRRWGRVLPFRFISAARMVPQLEPQLERWMFKCLQEAPRLAGRTIMLCDVSSSMEAPVSSNSDLRRVDAMRALAMLLREVCEDVVLIPFAARPHAAVPPRRGFALVDLLNRKHNADGTDIGAAAHHALQMPHDRLIILTDEQSMTRVPAPVVKDRSYIINVAAHRNGIGYKSWLHISGWSEAVIDYIQHYEAHNETV